MAGDCGGVCSPLHPSVAQILSPARAHVIPDPKSSSSFTAEFGYKEGANRVNFVAGEKKDLLT